MLPRTIVDTRTTVETPEGVDFQFVIAGPGKRAMAFFIDCLVRFLVFFIMAIVIGFASSSGAIFGADGMAMAGTGGILFILFLLSWFYGPLQEAFWSGQTVGKRAIGLRVVRTNGTPIGWFEAFGRGVLLAADCFWFVAVFPLSTFALLSMSCTKKMQRLGDLVFDTMVIDESREFVGRGRGVTEGIEAIPRAHCSGRYHVPERTLAVIERLFEGDRLISANRREEIARPVSQALIARLGYEDPGPGGDNPNPYFVNAPVAHTLFLRRILKTFALDENDPAEKNPFGDSEETTTSRLKRSQRRQQQQWESASPSAPPPPRPAQPGRRRETVSEFIDEPAEGATVSTMPPPVPQMPPSAAPPGAAPPIVPPSAVPPPVPEDPSADKGGLPRDWRDS